MSLISLLGVVGPFLKEAFWGKQKIGSYLVEHKLVGFLLFGVLLLTLTNYVLFEQIYFQSQEILKQAQRNDELEMKDRNNEILQEHLNVRISAQLEAIRYFRKHEDELLDKLVKGECRK